MKMRTWAEDLRDTTVVGLICFIIIMVLRFISKQLGYTEYVPVIDFIYDLVTEAMINVGKAFADFAAPFFGF